MTDRELMQQPQRTHWEGCEEVHPECRKPEREPVAWVDESAIRWLADRKGKTSAHCTTQLSAARSCEQTMPIYTTPQPRQWVGLTDEKWKELWEEFNDGLDALEEEFQERMTVKHGEGYYLINPEESWKSQQELIQRLVEAKLKEKNT